MKKPFYKSWWFIALAAIFILSAISTFANQAGLLPTEEEDVEDKQPVAKQPIVESKDVQIKNEVEKIVKKELKEKNNDKKDRIVELKVSEQLDDKYNIILTMNADTVSSRAKEIMWEKTTKVLKQLSTIENTNNILIEWLYHLQDQYGNVEDERIMMFNISLETRAKINWDNFNFMNISNVSDSYFEHPALSE